ncbi:myosin-binding protein 1 isoform X2 [Humulus lupulus]|uniref:myosin-binding protein 1 isoform X2 n=1 Tax=Humulus lupulus TaxID=3486 RepID=UPI002B406B39|nr:myosin-binding protein 1 isoform X2 [Humulus lupulus]
MPWLPRRLHRPNHRESTDPLLGDHKISSSSTRNCACCNQPWAPRAHAQVLSQSKLVGLEAAELERSLSGAIERNQDSLKEEKSSVSIIASHSRKDGLDPLSHIQYTELNVASDTESEGIEENHNVIKERSLESIIDSHSGNGQLNPLSHIRYTELKISSDTESESPFSTDEGVSALIRGANEYKEEFSVQCVEPRVVTLDTDLAFDEGVNSPIPKANEYKEEFSVQCVEPCVVTLDADLAFDDGASTPIPKANEYKQELSVQCVEPCVVTVDADLTFDEGASSPIPNANEYKEEFSVRCVEPCVVTQDADLVFDEGVSSLIPEANEYKEEFSIQCIEPCIVTPDADSASDKLIDPASGPKPSILISEGQADADLASDKLIDPASGPKPSILISEVQADAVESFDFESPESTIAAGHGLEQLNWQQVVEKENIPAQTESPHSPASSHTVGIPVEVSKSCLDNTRSGEVEDTSMAECGEVCKEGATLNTTSETGLERNPIASDSGLQAPNLLDLGDAYKLAVGNRGKQLSGLLAEQWIGKDASKVSEDLKFLLSHLSVTRGTEQPMNEISPKFSLNSDDFKTLDSSNSIGMHILQKRISLERNESGLSIDGSIVSEIEGESVVDRFKRQVEHDKKLMTAMYKELEEERSASAIATNQAMAMITRLQEEKAALHMEALQYLRMMEEQAEYDDDELQKSNDLLAEKEKEIQDLEAELELYRQKFPSERVMDFPSESSYDVVTDIAVDNSKYSCIGDKLNVSNQVEDSDISFKNADEDNLNSSMLEFEDEKLYILDCLKKLEKTLHLLPDDGEIDTEELNCKGHENSRAETNTLSAQHNESVSGQDLHAEGNSSSLEKHELNGIEGDEVCYSRESPAELSRATDSTSLETIVSDLNKRLEALEADRKFLEHTVNSLRNGDEGVQFIHEIASHLRELRNIALKKDQTVS